MDTLEAIKTRRCIREYTDQPVSVEHLDLMIEAARWAPSGLNNQPWRFMKVTNRELIKRLSQFTRYRGLIAGAPAVIVVFLDHGQMYDRTKDIQSVGAAIQNMLLAAHNAGLGACWVGEILNRKKEVEGLLRVPSDFELMAVVTVGHPVEKVRVGVRHPFEQFIIPPPGG